MCVHYFSLLKTISRNCMWIVVVAWVYVVGMMSIAEAQTSVVGAVMTFLAYCVVPLTILLYITGGKARRARRAAQEGSSDSHTSDTSGQRSASSTDDSTRDNDCDSGKSGDNDSCSDSGSSDSSSD
jgi:hypothetical protein